MQFLEPFMKYRITEDIEMESQTNAQTNKQSDQDVSTTEAIDVRISKQENHPLNKRKCLEYVDRRHQEHVTDALESFFECILKSTRDMPPWMQTQVKKKIFAVVIEAEEQLSFHDNNMSTPQQHLIIEAKIKTEAPDET